jgi:hypothetical protein
LDSLSINYLYQEDLYYFKAPVLVVLPRSWDSYSPEEQNLLHKILTSVRISWNSIQLIIQPLVVLKSLAIYSPSRVLIFGSETAEKIMAYEETQAQGFIVISADDLNRLDDQKKKNLWTALRQMFGV